MIEGKGCSHNESKQNEQADQEVMLKRMQAIKNKILVLSGKGGVRKSTIAVILAVALSRSNKNLGLLDIDIHGPSVPKLLHMEDVPLNGNDDSILPIEYTKTLKVMSIGFMLQEKNEAVIWRGPMKHGVIKQFLTHVAWGELDYLIVDSTPGTGDEPLSIAQLLKDDAKAVIVTTPQEIALTDVRKSIAFCRKVSLPIMGVIENMSGFVCPHCQHLSEIFKSGGGEEMALAMEVPFLGSIPIEPGMVEACDSGEPYVHQNQQTGTAAAFDKVIQVILEGSKG